MPTLRCKASLLVAEMDRSQSNLYLVEDYKDIQLIAFDIIVCALGISFPTVLATPGQSPADRKAEVENVSNFLTSPSTNVVIAGGGHVGVEIAGDVLEEHPPDGTGSITLVCSS
jgi:NADH dehydrogenase FAD-containing subunit